jgi:hypothetical protein
MSEPLTHYLHRHADLQQDRGMGMAAVVQSDAQWGRLGDVAVEDLDEQVWVRPAFEGGECPMCSGRRRVRIVLRAVACVRFEA